jgi:hypothetical protein
LGHSFLYNGPAEIGVDHSTGKGKPGMTGAGNVENLQFVPQKVLQHKPIISQEAQNASGKTRPKKRRILREKRMVHFSRTRKPSKTSGVAGEKIPRIAFSLGFGAFLPPAAAESLLAAGRNLYIE